MTVREDGEAVASPEGEGNAEAATSGTVEVSPEVEQLRAEVAAAKTAHDQLNTRLRAVSKAYTELQSEMKAFKERMEHRAKLDSELQAFDQVRRFFDPVMNLKRSLAATSDSAALVQGLGIVQHQFMEVLHSLGLTEVPGVGANFDPQVHEALAVQPVTDKSQDGKVLLVHTIGYAVGGRVLQAAQVVIGKFEESAGEA